MAWGTSTRKATLPKNWPAIQAEVILRARGRCQHVREDTGGPCGEPANQADHVVPHSEGGGDGFGNLRALCEYHHTRKSGREGARGLARARARDRAERPPHPGVLP